MPQPLVETHALARVHQRGKTDVHALCQADVVVQRGEFVAIQGRSGSGKSTLLQILGCLDRATSGRYVLGGIDVAGLSDRELAHVRAERIGFVFQTFHLLPDLNVIENVELPFVYRRESRPVARARALAALTRVGLDHRLHHTPNALSGGEMQRVAVARALAIQPDLILADEPTGNLDRETGLGVMNLIRELHGEGATIVLVTHDPEIASSADRVLHMVDGVLGAEASR